MYGVPVLYTYVLHPVIYPISLGTVNTPYIEVPGSGLNGKGSLFRSLFKSICLLCFSDCEPGLNSRPQVNNISKILDWGQKNLRKYARETESPENQDHWRPSWELTYPIPRHFWTWFSFSQGGIWVFPKIMVPPNHPFNRVFHYKPSILGYPYFWKHPYVSSLEGNLKWHGQKKPWRWHTHKTKTTSDSQHFFPTWEGDEKNGRRVWQKLNELVR